MKIVFFDHVFHKKSESSNFFLDILRTLGNVEVYYWDFSKQEEDSLLKNNFIKDSDLLVFWQILPPTSFLSKINHDNILLIPMYDACCTLTYRKWYAYRKCHFICFSKKLYNVFCRLGVHSLYLQYVPVIAKMEINKERSRHDGLKAFVWRRSLSLNVDCLFRSLKDIGVKTIIFRDLPDASLSDEYRDKVFDGINVRYVNKWFATHEDYLESILTCDVYVAPRLYEGIGLSFLEAMGLGLCVMAPDQPTMNEYIIDGYNGVLFKSFKSLGKKKLNILAIKKQAKESYQQYLNRWNQSIPQIYSFLYSIDSNRAHKFNSPYWYLWRDIDIFFRIRVIPYIKRKLRKSDY